MEEESESPTKFSMKREGPYTHYASNNTHYLTNEMDTTQGGGLLVNWFVNGTQQDLEISEDNLSILAAILNTETMNINQEGRWFATDDHSY